MAAIPKVKTGAGIITGEVLVKKVKGSKHMLHTPPAWAIDRTMFEAARKAGVQTIQIIDKEANVSYSVEFRVFAQKCKPMDRGYGPQLFLPLHNWKKSDVDELQGVQESLF